MKLCKPKQSEGITASPVQKAKTAERVTKRAAIAEGVRSDAAPNAGDIQDLLDTGAQAAAAELSGYHDRSRHTVNVQSQKKYSSGDMDEICDELINQLKAKKG